MKKKLIIIGSCVLAAFALAQTVTFTRDLSAVERQGVKYYIRSQAGDTNSVWFGVTDPTTAQIKAAVETNTTINMPEFVASRKAQECNRLWALLNGQSVDGMAVVETVCTNWPADFDKNAAWLTAAKGLVVRMKDKTAAQLNNALP